MSGLSRHLAGRVWALAVERPGPRKLEISGGGTMPPRQTPAVGRTRTPAVARLSDLTGAGRMDVDVRALDGGDLTVTHEDRRPRVAVVKLPVQWRCAAGPRRGGPGTPSLGWENPR